MCSTPRCAVRQNAACVLLDGRELGALLQQASGTHRFFAAVADSRGRLQRERGILSKVRAARIGRIIRSRRAHHVLASCARIMCSRCAPRRVKLPRPPSLSAAARRRPQVRADIASLEVLLEDDRDAAAALQALRELRV